MNIEQSSHKYWHIKSRRTFSFLCKIFCTKLSRHFEFGNADLFIKYHLRNWRFISHIAHLNNSSCISFEFSNMKDFVFKNFKRNKKPGVYSSYIWKKLLRFLKILGFASIFFIFGQKHSKKIIPYIKKEKNSIRFFFLNSVNCVYIFTQYQYE